MKCVIPLASCCGLRLCAHEKGKGDTNLTLVLRAQSRGKEGGAVSDRGEGDGGGGGRVGSGGHSAVVVVGSGVLGLRVS